MEEVLPYPQPPLAMEEVLLNPQPPLAMEEVLPNPQLPLAMEEVLPNPQLPLAMDNLVPMVTMVVTVVMVELALATVAVVLHLRPFQARAPTLEHLVSLLPPDSTDMFPRLSRVWEPCNAISKPWIKMGMWTIM
jgi:hypothetical protein